MAYLMGIDLGTSSLKVLIMDEVGNIISQSAKDYQFSSPRNGYAEQDTTIWWEACCYCTKDALSKLGAPAEEVVGVSFSGQMHGLVPLDDHYEVIRPAILHCDARSDKQIKAIKETLGEQEIQDVILNPIYTGFLLPSLLWIRDNEFIHYSKINKVCLPKDFLKLKFTGELVTDYSDASATLAFDVIHFTWAETVMSKLNIPREWFPNCLGTDAPIGKVTKKASRESGLAEGTIVVNGGGDQIMQAIGNGAIRPNSATVNIGTSGQVCYQSDVPIKNSNLNTNTFCSFRKGRWITMGATMSAGLSLKWFHNLFTDYDYSEVNRSVENIKPGSEGIIFLPYLSGERTPHLNPNLSGAFFGINTNTKRAQLTRAVMEGVAYSLMQCIELCNELGLSVDEMIASGGGSRSLPWLQLQSDIYNISLKVSQKEEQAGLGAAIVAGVGSGVYQSIEEGCSQVVKYKDTIVIPNHNNHELYRKYYKLYKEAFISCKSILEQVTNLGRNIS